MGRIQIIQHRKHQVPTQWEGRLLIFPYKDQPTNAVQGNSCCLLRESYETHVRAKWILLQVVLGVTTVS
jgi:hypothetical protein